MGRRSKLTGALAVAALAILPADASACACAPFSPEEGIAAGERAVIAKLVEVRKRTERQGPPVGPGSADFIYKVKRVIEGPDQLRAKRRLKIRSSLEGSACGLPRRLKRYGLFLYRDRSGSLSSNLCGVTSARRMRRAAREVAEGSRLAAARVATCSASRA